MTTTDWLLLVVAPVYWGLLGGAAGWVMARGSSRGLAVVLMLLAVGGVAAVVWLVR